jgi:D-methionine transport system substrate-binding protein
MFSAIFFLMTRKIVNLILALTFLSLAFSLAGPPAAWAQPGERLGPPPIRVGVARGPERELMEKVKEIVARRGQAVELVHFNASEDSLRALAAGQIDLSASQHKPMLEEFAQRNNLSLISLGNVYVAPLSFYSQKIKTLAEIEPGARIVISAEPDKKKRALRLLSQYGLIKLADGAGRPTKSDVIDNPNNLELIEADVLAPFLNNAAVEAVAFSGMSKSVNSQVVGRPKFRLLMQEDPAAPYVYVLAARRSGAKKPLYLEFARDYQSQEMAQFMLRQFEGTVMPVYELQ